MTKREFAKIIASLNWSSVQSDSPDAGAHLEFIKDYLLKMKKGQAIDLMLAVWEARTLTAQYPDKNSPFKDMLEFPSVEYDKPIADDFQSNLPVNDRIEILTDALQDIDLESDFVDPPSTVKRCGEIARKALSEFNISSVHIPGSVQTDELPPRLEQRSG
jgi:hypothetical protein